MHVVTLADDDTNSILFMTEVSVKSRRMAVTSNCVNEKEFFQLETRRRDPNLSNSYRLIPVHCLMKAVEAVKVKFYCFLGIVHPTVYNTVGEPD